MMNTNENGMHIITWGGIGDVILLTPVLREIKKRSPHSLITVHAMHGRHHDVLLHNPHIDVLRLEWKPIRFLMKLLRNLGYLPARFHVPNYGEYAPSLWVPQRHASEIIGELLGVQLSTSKPELFLTADEEKFGCSAASRFNNPIAIHSQSSRIIKDWPMEHWLALISRNPQLAFMELGALKRPRLQGTADFPNVLTLRQEFALLKYCKAFIGVESCYAHAAAALSVPSIVLFGASNPSTWGHAGSICISSGIRCSPCIDIIGNSKCPYDVSCLKMITVENVETELRRQLEMTGSKLDSALVRLPPALARSL